VRPLLAAIDAFYTRPPDGVRVVVLTGSGGHFCSGLDLSEHVARDAETTMRHSRNWHRVMEAVQFGGLVTVSAMEGAVIGGGLELAAATHVRIAEPSVIFQLPEGRRGTTKYRSSALLSCTRMLVPSGNCVPNSASTPRGSRTARAR
jgi:enoyl-CoA hydratase/carnithine racemase